MIKDLIIALVLATLIDLAWNSVGLRDPLPPPLKQDVPLKHADVIPQGSGSAGQLLMSSGTAPVPIWVTKP